MSKSSDRPKDRRSTCAGSRKPTRDSAGIRRCRCCPARATTARRSAAVAAHPGLNLAEYDDRIRTFIPDYEEMLDVAADAVPRRTKLIVDLGTGTGALAARCARRAPGARIVGIDADEAILAVASRRLGRRASFITDSFLRADLPRCDALVASFALHHVRTRRAKAGLYRRLRRSLKPGGRLIIVDCCPSAQRAAALVQRDAWLAHLRQAYSARKARQLLDAWGREDVYVPLDAERALLDWAGFSTDVLWRKGAFAVLVGL